MESKICFGAALPSAYSETFSAKPLFSNWNTNATVNAAVNAIDAARQ